MKIKLTKCVIINKHTLDFLGEDGEEECQLEILKLDKLILLRFKKGIGINI
jgi:hypothetical protein